MAGLASVTGLLGLTQAVVPAGAAPQSRIALEPIGTYATGQFDESAAEIVAHDPLTQRLFVVNAQAGAIDVLDITDPSEPEREQTLSAQGGTVNSIAISDGVLAVAVAADLKQEPGSVELYDTEELNRLSTVEVGALPDMLTFTPDGTKVVVANEGEPDEYCIDGAGDPEGSVSIIDLADGTEEPVVRTAGFEAFNGDIEALQEAGVRIFGPGATVAEDLEPEYVAVDADSTTAWVSLQENNAFAIVDLESAEVTDLLPLGFKDHSIEGKGLDASNKDDEINIRTWPVRGMYQPDAIAAYEHGNNTYLVSANEGDARDYDCYSEETRIKDLELDADAFPNADQLQQNGQLGRLNTTETFGTEGVSELYSYGARSFSIWDEAGRLVFDSGDDFERITAEALSEDFNSNNDENGSFDARSDDKGPEPEGVEIGQVYSKTYAFIGLERVGGVMVYDITTPHNPKFVQYLNNRDFDVDAETDDGGANPEAGDLGPEGLTLIAAEDSPTGEPLLAVGNEVSGSTTLYRIDGPGKKR